MSVDKTLKNRLSLNRPSNIKKSNKTPVSKIVTESVKNPPPKPSESEIFKRELEEIAKRAEMMRILEEEEKLIQKKRDDEKLQEKLVSPFTGKKQVDMKPSLEYAIEELLPKVQIPEKIEYPEPFQEEPALNRELAEFKRKINQHLHQVGFAGSGGGGIGDIADAGDIDGGTALVNGKFLKYDSSTQKFVGADASSSGATAADDVSAGDAAVNITTTSGNITIDAAANNSDIIFKGTDDSSDITMLTLDGSAAGAATFNDKIVATELDISGDVDIDGTLEADAITVDGTTLAEFIADTTGAMVSSNTETGITVTYQDGDNTLDFALAAAQTTITSLLATDIKIGEDDQTKIDFETADEIHFYAANAHQIKLVDGALVPATDNDIDLGTSSVEFKDAFFDGTVTSDAFAGPLTGDVTGNADTATALATARNIAGVSFDGTANISLVLTNLGISDGSNGQFLKTDGSGNFSFAAASVSSLAADDIDAGDAAVNITTSSGNITIDAAANNTDIIFKGTDDSSDITMLTLDGSDAGKAIFNGAISATTITLSADGGVIVPDDGNIGSASSTAAMQISSGGIVTFADDIKIKDGGTIGTASDADAITIAAAGAVTFSQRDVHSSGITIADGGQIGSASDLNAITISSGGVVAITATTANTSASDGALTVAGGAGIAADLSVGDDLRLISDGAILSFGADSEIALTHNHNVGLKITSSHLNQGITQDSTNLFIVLDGTNAASANAGDNVIMDASAASTDVGDDILHEDFAYMHTGMQREVLEIRDSGGGLLKSMSGFAAGAI